MKVLDLTHLITEDSPVYPGTEPPVLAPASSFEKDGFKETLMTMFSHTGTHMDPPYHIFPDRTKLDEMPAEQFLGKGLVVDCRNFHEGEEIPLSHLLTYGKEAEEADFLLFNLGWDKRWGDPSYFGDYPCIADDLLDYIIAGEYKGIGFDVIGLDPIADEKLVRHHKLFREKDIVNIENLCNLEKCGKGLFWFGCFPLKYGNSDGAPIRAMAWWE